MSGETSITVIGNITADPELRFLSSGLAVVNFTVASTPRRLNRTTNEWEDQETLWVRCSIWRDYAEHVAASLRKGLAVIVIGTLRQRAWETPEGEKRTSWELDADEVAPSLRYAVAQVTRAARTGSAPADAWAPADAPADLVKA